MGSAAGWFGWVTVMAAVAATTAAAAPQVQNPSFEADGYATEPGYAVGNGGTITGWTYTGNVGINPIWDDPANRKGPVHAFSDNGKIPDGKQVLFIQNQGTLTQEIAGFEAGRKYRVIYWENARHNNAPDRNPQLQVTLGDALIVSAHAIKPVDDIDSRAVPYQRVESAVFTPPASGAFKLVFTALAGDRVSVLIDRVTVVEVP